MSVLVTPPCTEFTTHHHSNRNGKRSTCAKRDLRANKYDGSEDVKKERAQVEIDAGDVIMLSDSSSTEYPLWRHPIRCRKRSPKRNSEARTTVSSPCASSRETMYNHNTLSHSEGAAQPKGSTVPQPRALTTGPLAHSRGEEPLNKQNGGL